MKKEKENKLGYKIIKIQTLKFDFKEVDSAIIENLFLDENPVQINIKFNINFNKIKSEITIDVINYLAETNNSNYVSHSGRTIFKVIGLDEFYDKENNTFQLPDNFMVQLLSISFSHCRALLAVELSSTNFKDKYFLPVVDPLIMFKNIKENLN